MTIKPSPPGASPGHMMRSVGRGAIAATTMLGFVACSPGASSKPSPPVSETASRTPSVAATATVGPGRATTTVGGDFAELPIRFTMPAGWEMYGGWVAKSDNYGKPEDSGGPPFGFAFLDVANIYTDGCRWRLVDPQPGPTVDDLAAAYANVSGFVDARDTSVDGYQGKLVDYAVPDYQPDDCKQGVFGIFKEDNNSGDEPNILAQHPNQRNRIWILDVGGSRLVIHASYPADISAQNRTEIDAIIKSIDIG